MKVPNGFIKVQIVHGREILVNIAHILRIDQDVPGKSILSTTTNEGYFVEHSQEQIAELICEAQAKVRREEFAKTMIAHCAMAELGPLETASTVQTYTDMATAWLESE